MKGSSVAKGPQSTVKIAKKSEDLGFTEELDTDSRQKLVLWRLPTPSRIIWATVYYRLHPENPGLHKEIFSTADYQAKHHSHIFE